MTGFDNDLQSVVATYWDKWKAQSSELMHIDWRKNINGLRRAFVQITHAVEPGLPDLREHSDFDVAGGDERIRARKYVPHGAAISQAPCLVYFHGGGFVLGDLDSFDSICRRLADASDCVVISVEYRLAPEHKYPAAIEDAVSAYKWIYENASELGIDQTRIAVGGDSAGGNLAINITRAALKTDLEMPVFQLLIYPLTQFADIRSKGIKLQEESVFSAEVFELFQKAYLDDEDPMQEDISPLFASEWIGLPPAHLVSAGLDPLKDEGQAYIQKLEAAGIQCTVQEHALQPHGFFCLTAMSAASRNAIKEAADILRQNMTPSLE
jgi:acetyl esterase